MRALRGSFGRSWTHSLVVCSSLRKLFIGGNLNEHVCSTRVGLRGYMGVSDMGVGTKVRVS
jgi:hypothetical protein